MKLYLLRHGETDYNRRQALQGQMDAPLNENGRRQALGAAAQLEGIHFDAVYSSPLQRAKHTALLATDLPERALTIDRRIIELGFGIWEGKECRTLGPQFAPFFQAPQDYVPPKGGESFEQLVARVSGFLQDMAERWPDGTVLAVSHGAAIHAMLLAAQHKPLSEFWAASVGNCGIAVLEHDGAGWTLSQACATPDVFYG